MNTAKHDFDPTALFRIPYGLYLITSSDGMTDNGMICNAVMQLTDSPARVAVCLSKICLTHDLVLSSGEMNVCCLTEKAPLAIFTRFGFQSGRDADKFAGIPFLRSANGLAVPAGCTGAYFSLAAESSVDVGTHTLCICRVTDAAVLSDEPTVTYSFYREHIKPAPNEEAAGKTVWECSMCGHVYEGEELPADYVCPVCSHSAAFFSKKKR